MIRPATQHDSAAFHDLARLYLDESGQHREYSVRQTQAAFMHAIDDTSSLVMLAEATDGLAGGIIVQLDHAFTADPVALVSMFYVRREYRGTGLSRALLTAAVEWADSAECSHTFASANAMLDAVQTQQFVNLCRKFGFTPAGSPVLSRRKPS